ncbi:MAG TPA: glycosyltransferase, partial [Bacteroidales bacterium]|nr:glycosyltransferase [Bacteroidales bacterium]
ADEEFESPDGIKVFPVKGWNKGIRMIRTFTHRLPLLYSTLRDQNADVYYCRIRDSRHIIAWWAARKVRARFILGLAEDLDVMSFSMRWKYFYITYIRNPWVLVDGFFCEIVYPWLLHKSDFVFAQHEGQKEMLSKRGIKSIVFNNLIDLSLLPSITPSEHNHFIYVGWIDKRKGFAQFFELVKNSPQHLFKVVGPPRDKEGHFYYEKLKSFQNVSLLGKLDHSDTLFQIASSKALISTSHMEGFPNIFIEAWAYGIPVLSLNVDPGSTIKKENLGEVLNGDLNGMVQAIDSFRYTNDFAERAKAYVERTHVLNEAKINEISQIFTGLYKTQEEPNEVTEKLVN